MPSQSEQTKPRTYTRAYRDSRGEVVTVLHGKPSERQDKTRSIKHG